MFSQLVNIKTSLSNYGSQIEGWQINRLTLLCSIWVSIHVHLHVCSSQKFETLQIMLIYNRINAT